MWSLWLIVAIAVGSAVALTTSGVLVAVYVERRRHKRRVVNPDIDRSQSQHHRPHLSITDIDFTSLSLPRGTFRQSLQASRGAFRFYTTVPSEDDLRTHTNGAADSLPEVAHMPPMAKRPNQWLGADQQKKLERRPKKSIKLSISAPMAKFPAPVTSPQHETAQKGSPEPVELPAHTTPKVTPERTLSATDPVPRTIKHVRHTSTDSITSANQKQANRVSTRMNYGQMLKSRSVSMGSIAAPPDCPLPPMPTGMPQPVRDRPLRRSKSNLSSHRRSISLLNTPLLPSPVPGVRPSSRVQTSTNPSETLSAFAFDWDKENLQIIRVESIDDNAMAKDVGTLNRLKVQTQPLGLYELDGHDSLKDTDSPLQTSTPTIYMKTFKCDSRPVSIISLTEYGAGNPKKFDSPSFSRPVSMSSEDFFRQSVVGPNASILATNNSRSRGHKRQNCIRISGITSFDVNKKRISSQLDRLAEAEETDGDENSNVGITIPTLSPARPARFHSLRNSSPAGQPNLDVPKIRQPQNKSLRMKRPGIRDRQRSEIAVPKLPGTELSCSLPPLPSNSLNHSRTSRPRFVYAGSPSSDPTKPPLPVHTYSPNSPSEKIDAIQNAKTHSLTHPRTPVEVGVAYSPASSPLHFSTAPSSTNPTGSETTRSVTDSPSPRRYRTQLHGPRSAPPPSLRTRNVNHVSPRLREAGSPIRKAVVSATSTTSSTATPRTQKRNSSAHDELHRKIALFKSLTHAAEVRKAGGLPAVNLVNKHANNTIIDGQNSDFARTPSSRYTETPKMDLPEIPIRPMHKADIDIDKDHIRGLRQRSRTVGGYSFQAPKLRQERTYPIGTIDVSSPLLPPAPPLTIKANNKPVAKLTPSISNISIWEDASVNGDDASDSPTKSQPSPQPELKTSVPQHHRHSIISTSDRAIHTNVITPLHLKKEPLWKLQQLADISTAHALAYNENLKSSSSLSSCAVAEPENKDTPLAMTGKNSKLDGFWGDRSLQLQQQHPIQPLSRPYTGVSSQPKQQQQQQQQRQFSPQLMQMRDEISRIVTTATSTETRSTPRAMTTFTAGNTVPRKKRSHTVGAGSTTASRDGKTWAAGTGVDSRRGGTGTGTGGRGVPVLRTHTGVGLGVDLGKGIGPVFLNEMERDGIGRLR